MKSSVFLQGLAAVCIATTASAVSSPDTAIQLFGPADVRLSTNGTGYGANEDVFNTKILNLTCPASPTGIISSTTDGTGNVLVDNFITLSVTAGSTYHRSVGHLPRAARWRTVTNKTASPRNIPASASGLVGTDPDTLCRPSRRSASHQHQQQPAGRLDPGDSSAWWIPAALLQVPRFIW